MADELVTIAEYPDSMQAELARQVLEDFKIPAIIVGQNAGDGRIGIFETIKLQVRQSDAVKAKEILDEQQQGHEPEEFEVRDETDDDEPHELDEEEK